MQHALARPDSQFLRCTCVYFLCDILWSAVQSHSDNSHMHATGPHSACALAQARPTMSCIHLVIVEFRLWLFHLGDVSKKGFTKFTRSDAHYVIAMT